MNERIKKIRLYYALTLEEFGTRIGITKSSLSRLENGLNNPSERTIMLICREFGVSYAWLKDGVGEMILPTDEDEAVNRLMLGENEFAKSAFRILAKLPPDAWAAIESFVDSLSAENPKKKNGP